MDQGVDRRLAQRLQRVVPSLAALHGLGRAGRRAHLARDLVAHLQVLSKKLHHLVELLEEVSPDQLVSSTIVMASLKRPMWTCAMTKRCCGALPNSKTRAARVSLSSTSRFELP